jgi:2,3-bisphosphoglycerate-dependent phosphoglycerate mutase
MSARAVAAIRETDAAVEAEFGGSALWVAVTHGDVVKAVVADALGQHLDLFQRIVVDPGSATVIRYTPARPMVLTVNSVGGSLPGRPETHGLPGDAAVGGGAGSAPAGSAG